MGNHFFTFLVRIVVVTFFIIDQISVIAAADVSVDNNFENGVVKPWIDESKTAVKWKIENRNSPWEPENLPLSGSNYLRVDRGTSLSFGVAILRSPVFSLLTGTNATFSFSFWIRSKWPQFTNLELYLAKNRKDSLLLSLYEYSDVNNREWRQSETVNITDNTNSDLTLVFYAYCGNAVEDAVAIDDLYFFADAILTTETSPSSGTDSTSSTTTPTSAISSTSTDAEMSSQTSEMTASPTTVETTKSEIITTTPDEIITTTYSTFPVTDPISTEESSPGTTDSTLTTTLAEEKCPEFLQDDTSVPCYTIGTQCYCFYKGSEQLTWTSANQFCRDGSMTLLTIETLEEDQSIYDHVKSISELQNTLYWTAGKYSQDIDGWEWASNEPFDSFSYTHWGVGEPNGATDEYCVYADFNQKNFSAGYWYDDRCAAPGFKFICEQND
ncbi:uncharacterized protein LOC124190864 [Daphnia pulex]|uniref:uncharacterized protein LOC124190864 n=1 Tax=Daphnia pulex TaxID=6669 RepID=UPI001EDE136D|nr:uncharacterized protein LOC124190864 [Daphnia pulex]